MKPANTLKTPGSDIRRIRDYLQMDRASFAAMVGYSAAYLAAVESGHAPVSRDFLKAAWPAICQAAETAHQAHTGTFLRVATAAGLQGLPAWVARQDPVL